jgi:hypothetical protein
VQSVDIVTDSANNHAVGCAGLSALRARFMRFAAAFGYREAAFGGRDGELAGGARVEAAGRLLKKTFEVLKRPDPEP